MVKETERQLVSFDWAVKKLLRSKANFDVLEGFLSELLEDDIKIVEVLESESNKDNESDKYNRVDIKVKNSKGEILIIEVQFNDENDFFHRILYATSKTICEHLDEGDPYSKVSKVISINILYFDFGDGNDYIYKGKTEFNSLHNMGRLKLNEEQQRTFKKEYPEEIFPEFYIIKINNFNDIAKSPLDEWIYLFKNSAIKSSFTAKGIKKAGQVLDKLKLSKEERAIYDRFIDNRRIALGQLTTALMKGKSEGFKEGLKHQENKIKQIEKDLQEKDTQLQEKDIKLQEKDTQLQEKDTQLQEKDTQLKESEQKHQEQLRQIALTLFNGGNSKEEVFSLTGIRL